MDPVPASPVLHDATVLDRERPLACRAQSNQNSQARLSGGPGRELLLFLPSVVFPGTFCPLSHKLSKLCLCQGGEHLELKNVTGIPIQGQVTLVEHKDTVSVPNQGL